MRILQIYTDKDLNVATRPICAPDGRKATELYFSLHFYNAENDYFHNAHVTFDCEDDKKIDVQVPI